MPGDRKQGTEESPVHTHSLQLNLGAPRVSLSEKEGAWCGLKKDFSNMQDTDELCHSAV